MQANTNIPDARTRAAVIRDIAVSVKDHPNSTPRALVRLAIDEVARIGMETTYATNRVLMELSALEEKGMTRRTAGKAKGDAATWEWIGPLDDEIIATAPCLAADNTASGDATPAHYEAPEYTATALDPDHGLSTLAEKIQRTIERLEAVEHQLRPTANDDTSAVALDLHIGNVRVVLAPRTTKLGARDLRLIHDVIAVVLDHDPAG